MVCVWLCLCVSVCERKSDLLTTVKCICYIHIVYIFVYIQIFVYM